MLKTAQAYKRALGGLFAYLSDKRRPDLKIADEFDYELTDFIHHLWQDDMTEAKACDLVSSILIGDETERQKNATNRLPEKGYVDFVPYEKIDNLWNSIEELSKEYEEKDLEKLLLARSQMEVTLEKYYNLMKVSEQGMMSARALSS